MTGLLVAFMGIDGIGKTTLARALASELAGAGVPVRPISWRAALDESTSPWPRDALQQLWLETFRCLYAGGTTENGVIRLPRDYDRWAEDAWEQRLSGLSVLDNSPGGAVAAALAELAGNVILATEVIAPAIRDGVVVIQETFPYKHVLKELVVAERLAAEKGTTDVASMAQRLRATARSLFAVPPLQPDIGLLVDGPATLAYRWRVAQANGVGALEDLGVAGFKGEQSFIALQEATAAEFRDCARDWGWLHHRVDDAGLDANVNRGLGILLSHPLLAGRTHDEPTRQAGDLPVTGGDRMRKPYKSPELRKVSIRRATAVA